MGSGLQTYEYDRKTDVDKNDDDKSRYVSDYVVPEEEEFAQFGDSHFGTIARHYLSKYLKGDLSIDTVYGFRKENIGTFMVGESPMTVEENFDVNVRGVTYEGSNGLWEFLTKTNIDRSLVTPHDVRSYKRVLHSMSEHLSEIKRVGLIKTIRCSMYRDVI